MPDHQLDVDCPRCVLGNVGGLSTRALREADSRGTRGRCVTRVVGVASTGLRTGTWATLASALSGQPSASPKRAPSRRAWPTALWCRSSSSRRPSAELCRATARTSGTQCASLKAAASTDARPCVRVLTPRVLYRAPRSYIRREVGTARMNVRPLKDWGTAATKQDLEARKAMRARICKKPGRADSLLDELVRACACARWRFGGACSHRHGPAA